MKKLDQKDVILQGAILGLGKRLTDAVNARMYGQDQEEKRPAVIASETTRILSLVRPSVNVREILGIHKTEKKDDDGIRLRIIAYLAWQAIAEGYSSKEVADVALAAMTARKDSQNEQLLIARDCIGRMIRSDLLRIKSERRSYIDATISLSLTAYSYSCGGMQSLGDFLPFKIDADNKPDDSNDEDESSKPGSENFPTAKELYEKVRVDVVGIDPQVKVLASRFALHTARADAIKAGLDDSMFGQMVVCLVGSSGASKSYLASKMSKASGLPYVQFDSTTLTASGYVGSDLDDVYKLLVSAAGGKVETAAKGICFLDEFDKKSSIYGRDVNGEAVQMELLSKLQATTTPFLVGGKRSGDFTKQFKFDGRSTGYILAGVFAGLDDEIEKMSGRKNIGFVNQSGDQKHIRIADCLKELGFLDELVNRIGLVLRLPDPTLTSVMRATSGGILNGFNSVLITKNMSMLLTPEAVRIIGEYSIETKGFYRSSQSILATLSEEMMFSPPKERYRIFNDGDVRIVIERLSSGFVPLDDDNQAAPAAPNGEYDLNAEDEPLRVRG